MKVARLSANSLREARMSTPGLLKNYFTKEEADELLNNSYD